MHSLNKMAALRYFPSIHDKTAENKPAIIWAYFDPQPIRLSSLTIGSTLNYINKGCNVNGGQLGSNARQVGADPAWTTSGCLAAPGYDALDVFGVTAEDPGSVSGSEEEEKLETLIRMKEMELGNMIGGTSEGEEMTIKFTCVALREFNEILKKVGGFTLINT